jgi:DNA-binding response OmpR family regulator
VYMRVLIVAKEPTCLNVLERPLREVYLVDATTSFTRALKMAQSYPYDVIVLFSCDSVFELSSVCRELRGAGVETPILIVGKNKTVRHKVYFLDHGADDYLPSPFNEEELTARIRALARRNNSLREVASEFYLGDIRVDPSNRTLTHKNTQVLLRRKEFEVFEYLVLNKGKVVTKETLLDRLCGYDSDLSLNNVEVYICSLRGKLQKHFNKNYIYTVYGFGYKVSD